MGRELIMMIGVPASGKSTKAGELVMDAQEKGIAARVFSSDAIREALFGDEAIQGNPQQIFELLHQGVVNWLDIHWEAPCLAVYDATNINDGRRADFVKRLRELFPDIKCTAIVCAPSIEWILEHNAARKRVVPEEVIFNMLRHWTPVTTNEGWDEIYVWRPRGTSTGLWSLLDKCDFDQKNSHHNQTLQQHILSVIANTRDAVCEASWISDSRKIVLYGAAEYHDFGKIYTQTGPDQKGEYHYYSHEAVSTYLYLTSLNYPIHGLKPVTDIHQEIQRLIYYHMLPHRTPRKGETWRDAAHRLDLDDTTIWALNILHIADDWRPGMALPNWKEII